MIDILTRSVVAVAYLVTTYHICMYWKTAPNYVRPFLLFLGASVFGWVVFYVLLIVGWIPFEVARPVSRALHFPLAVAIAGIVGVRRRAAS